jgi:hypothetical protein
MGSEIWGDVRSVAARLSFSLLCTGEREGFTERFADGPADVAEREPGGSPALRDAIVNDGAEGAKPLRGSTRGVGRGGGGVEGLRDSNSAMSVSEKGHSN